MMLFQGRIMHATRKKNQGEYVILALGRKPKGCIVCPLLLLGPGNPPKLGLIWCEGPGALGQSHWSISGLGGNAKNDCKPRRI
ncbi:hypothetical protein LINPERPRIM_LOCUS36353 [Linum perenne]